MRAYIFVHKSIIPGDRELDEFTRKEFIDIVNFGYGSENVYIYNSIEDYIAAFNRQEAPSQQDYRCRAINL